MKLIKFPTIKLSGPGKLSGDLVLIFVGYRRWRCTISSVKEASSKKKHTGSALQLSSDLFSVFLFGKSGLANHCFVYQKSDFMYTLY